MELRKLPYDLTVCKVESMGDIDLEDGFFFIGRTEDELSLTCRTDATPPRVIEREDGWKAFVIEGVLDFSLVGVLSQISNALADAGIGIFVVSTYNTDYILVKAEKFDRAEHVLTQAGHKVA